MLRIASRMRSTAATARSGVGNVAMTASPMVFTTAPASAAMISLSTRKCARTRAIPHEGNWGGKNFAKRDLHHGPRNLAGVYVISTPDYEAASAATALIIATVSADAMWLRCQ